MGRYPERRGPAFRTLIINRSETNGRRQMMDNNPSRPQLANSGYPGWLYGISVLWGTLMGILLYASARFPLWYIYWLGPSSAERGPFWDAGVFVVMMMTGLMSAVYFWLIMRRTQARYALRWAYPLATILILVLVLTPLVIWWYVDSPWADVVGAVSLWLLYGVPALICLVPFGLLSGVIFYAITKPKPSIDNRSGMVEAGPNQQE